MKVAIIGAGVSGLAAADHLFSRKIDFTVFEASDQIGGHACSIEVKSRGCSLESGVVALFPFYVNLFAWYRSKGIATKPFPSSITVLVSRERDGIECRISLKHLLNPFKSLRFALEHLALSHALRQADGGDEVTFDEFLRKQRFSERFIFFLKSTLAEFVLALRQADVSNNAARVIASYYLRLRLADPIYKLLMKPRTFDPSSKAVYEKIAQPFKDRIRLRARVTGVARQGNAVVLASAAGEERFDKLIVATSTGAQAARLLTGIAEADRALLSHFGEVERIIALHDDVGLLPLEAAIYNYCEYEIRPRVAVLDLTRAQNLSGAPLLQSWCDDDYRKPLPERLFLERRVTLPLPSAQSARTVAGGALDGLHDRYGIALAGSWAIGGEGCHEDAYVSGRRAAAVVLGEEWRPLEAPPIPRIHRLLSRLSHRLMRWLV